MHTQHQADAYDALQARAEDFDDGYLFAPGHMSEEQIALLGQGAGKAEQPKPPANFSITNLHGLYRAHVSGRTSRDPELTLFVEAESWAIAVTKIATAVAAMERSHFAQVAERIYNCHTAEAMIEMGESPDLELRIFEVGWSATLTFVEQPIFLVSNPAALCRKWLQTQPQMSAAAELLDAQGGAA